MRKTEEFSEEFSVLSENSSPAPHCSSLDLIGQFRLGQPLMILTPGVRILVLVLICSSLDLIGQFRLGQPLMILTPKMRILILVLISSSLDLISQFWLGEALLNLTARMRFLILVLRYSSLDLILWFKNWTFYGQKIGLFLVKIGRFMVRKLDVLWSKKLDIFQSSFMVKKLDVFWSNFNFYGQKLDVFWLGQVRLEQFIL